MDRVSREPLGPRRPPATGPLAVDAEGLAHLLGLDPDHIEEMIGTRAWATGHMPPPVEVGGRGRPVRLIWSVSAVQRWLDRGVDPAESLQPLMVDYKGLGRMLGYSPSKVRRLAMERAWEDERLPWPLFEGAPEQRMWAIRAIETWLERQVSEAGRWS